MLDVAPPRASPYVGWLMLVALLILGVLSTREYASSSQSMLRSQEEYKIGFGDVWDPGWDSPKWPNVNCMREMYNTRIACPVLVECFKRHGVSLLTSDTSQELPFWYSQPLGHRWSQNAVGAAALLNKTQTVLDFLTSHYHKSFRGHYVPKVNGQVSPGTMHGAVWFTAGTHPDYGYHDGRANPWATIHKLCPMIEPGSMTRGGPATNRSLIEYMIIGCLHGLGHGGYVAWYHKRRGYNACSDPGHVGEDAAMEAHTICSTAPSAATRSFCYAGFYHATFEHHDHLMDNKSWMWPCDTGLFPYPEHCFMYMNIVIGQTYVARYPDGRQLVEATGDIYQLWMQRTQALTDASPGNPSGICSSITRELSVLACIDGYAGMASGDGPFCRYFQDRFDQQKFDLVKLCTTLTVPPNTTFVESMWDDKMERRWFACVSGSSRYLPRENQCERLLTVPGQPYRLRVRAFNLCQLVLKDNFFIADVGTPASKRRTIQWDWDWWKQSDLENVAPSNNWTGAAPGWEFLEPYSNSPRNLVPFRFDEEQIMVP